MPIYWCRILMPIYWYCSSLLLKEIILPEPQNSTLFSHYVSSGFLIFLQMALFVVYNIIHSCSRSDHWLFLLLESSACITSPYWYRLVEPFARGRPVSKSNFLHTGSIYSFIAQYNVQVLLSPNFDYFLRILSFIS